MLLRSLPPPPPLPPPSPPSPSLPHSPSPLPQITPKVQILEFVEGEPHKFHLVTSDTRLHIKAPNLDEKQQWVKYLRSSILGLNTQATPTKTDRSGSGVATKGLLEPEAVTQDLQLPSPMASPRHKRKEFMVNGGNRSVSVVESSPTHDSPNGSTHDSKFGEFEKVSIL